MLQHHLRAVLGFPTWPLALAAIIAEVAWYAAVRRPYPWRDLAVSVAMHLVRLPVALVSAAVVVPISALVWSARPWTVPLDAWWGLALLFVGEEFRYYWAHRLGHRVRWIWASHAVRHSPAHIHLASAYRLGVTEVLSGEWVFYLPLCLLGFHPVAVMTTLAANLFYQFWLHNDIVGRLGPIKWVLNTPSHHRVHRIHPAKAAGGCAQAAAAVS
jgi:sterol desaturase/sphingolipid hydroxylase (fatty acid hydroxylase superfamily)